MYGRRGDEGGAPRGDDWTETGRRDGDTDAVEPPATGTDPQIGTEVRDGDPLASAGFLLRSPNRVRVLRCLAGGPTTRHDLERQTGVNRITLGRVVRDFEERHWLLRDGDEYVATATGASILSGLEDLLDALAAARRFGDVGRWFPRRGIDLDPAALADAAITRVDPSDPFGPYRRLVEIAEGASTVHLVADTVTAVELAREVIGGDRLDGEDSEGEATLLVDPTVADALLERPAADPARRWLRDREHPLRLRTGGAVPFSLVAADGSVAIALTDDRGFPRALVTTEDESVHEWAHEYVRSLWTDASPLVLDHPEIHAD